MTHRRLPGSAPPLATDDANHCQHSTYKPPLQSQELRLHRNATKTCINPHHNPPHRRGHDPHLLTVLSSVLSSYCVLTLLGPPPRGKPRKRADSHNFAVRIRTPHTIRTPTAGRLSTARPATQVVASTRLAANRHKNSGCWHGVCNTLRWPSAVCWR